LPAADGPGREQRSDEVAFARPDHVVHAVAGRSAVAELPLSAPRAVERQFRRLVVCQVGLPALFVGRQPHLAALGALRGQSDLFGAHPGAQSRSKSGTFTLRLAP
jgi:hypothetical protein